VECVGPTESIAYRESYELAVRKDDVSKRNKITQGGGTSLGKCRMEIPVPP
jgi:hypothetical protein